MPFPSSLKHQSNHQKLVKIFNHQNCLASGQSGRPDSHKRHRSLEMKSNCYRPHLSEEFPGSPILGLSVFTAGVWVKSLVWEWQKKKKKKKESDSFSDDIPMSMLGITSEFCVLCVFKHRTQSLAPTLWEIYYSPTEPSCPCILTIRWLRMSHRYSENEYTTQAIYRFNAILSSYQQHSSQS